MGHTHKQLTEAELRNEIAKTLDGAVSSFEAEINQVNSPGALTEAITQPKRRGRPKGSRNRPKEK